MTQSEDDLPARPQVPPSRDFTDSGSSDADSDSPDTDDEQPSEPLYANPEKLDQQLSDSAMQAVSIVGPITADCVVNVSPTELTVGASYEPTEDDGVVNGVCSLSNTAECVRTSGTKKIDGRYVPRKLEFERTFQFDSEVTSVSELRSELQSIFGGGISLLGCDSEDDSEDEGPPF